MLRERDTLRFSRLWHRRKIKRKREKASGRPRLLVNPSGGSLFLDRAKIGPDASSFILPLVISPDAGFLDFFPKGLSADAQQSGGLVFFPARLPQSLQQPISPARSCGSTGALMSSSGRYKRGKAYFFGSRKLLWKI